MEFKFKPTRRNFDKEDLILDIQEVARKLSQDHLTQKQYDQNGEFNSSAVIRKIGSWNRALKEAGLRVSNRLYIPEEELFKNLLKLWEYLGRQPRRSELELGISDFSQSPYNRTFNSWTNALKKFVEWVNQDGFEIAENRDQEISEKKRTGRDPSLRLRFMVFKRDNFTCVQCGASPAKDPVVELQVDHIKPWSKGGETTFENLQTLCSKCNLGKSNLE